MEGGGGVSIYLQLKSAHLSQDRWGKLKISGIQNSINHNTELDWSTEYSHTIETSMGRNTVNESIFWTSLAVVYNMNQRIAD